MLLINITFSSTLRYIHLYTVWWYIDFVRWYTVHWTWYIIHCTLIHCILVLVVELVEATLGTKEQKKIWS